MASPEADTNTPAKKSVVSSSSGRTAKLVRRASWLFAAIREGATELVVDLSRCGLIDSTGLCVLLQASRGLRDGNAEPHLAVCTEQVQVRRVFRVTAIDKVIPVFATRKEARAAFN